MRHFSVILRIFLLFQVVSFCTTSVVAQIAEGGTPASFALKEDVQLRSGRSAFTAPIHFDVDKLKEEDKMAEEAGTLLRTSVMIPVDLNMENAGEWSVLPDGIKIWRLAIKAPEAIAIMLYYDRFFIPDGGKLFIYNVNRTHILGAYTSRTNPGDKKFATEFVAGDDIIVEYNELQGQNAEKPDIRISAIGYGYNYLEVYNSTFSKFPDIFNQNCQVNVNCPEGNSWQDPKKGVARTIAPFGNSAYLCSGTVINNTAQDLTPYYLTAHHCFEDSNIVFDQIVFYFHYESDGCETTSPSDTKTLVGAQMLVDLSIKGSSDGALLKINTDIPADYGVFFNGWDRRNTAATSGTSIHHPKGEVKKISTYTTSLTSSRWTGEDGPGAADAHWQVDFVRTQSGFSQPEGGSSGSPLFNQAGLVVGTLTGGSAANCNTGSNSWYGKMWYHWDNNNSLAGSTKTMKDYLDPLNSGVETLPGIYNAILGDADLINLSVNPGELFPVFNTFQTGYTVRVSNDVTRITVSATPANENATVTGTGNHQLNEGANTIRIVVTAPDKSSSKTYTVTVTRAIQFAADKFEPNNTLAQAYSLPVSFTKDTASVITTGSNFHNETDIDYYRIDLPAGNNYIFSAWLYDLHNNDDNKTCTVDAKFSYSTNGHDWSDEFDDIMQGNVVLVNGGTVYFRAVPFFEGDVGDYLLEVSLERKQAGTNNNATLSDLSITPGILSPNFLPNILNYSGAVGNSVNGIIVSATASDANAIVSGVGYYNLEVGNNALSVRVTAQDGVTQRTYSITVIRRSIAGSNANLHSLTIDHSTLRPFFNTNTTSYTAAVTNDVTQINVSAIAMDSYATVTGPGDYPLKEGNNEIEVVVTAENGSTIKTYRVNVTRQILTSMEDVSHQPLIVWPNPASNQITITGLSGNGILSVFDAVGRERIRQTITSSQETIAVSSLPAGLYLLRITESDKARTIKIIVN